VSSSTRWDAKRSSSGRWVADASSATRSLARGSSTRRSVAGGSGTTRWSSRVAGDIAFHAPLDASVVAAIGSAGTTPIVATRNSAQYGRILVSEAIRFLAHSADQLVIETLNTPSGIVRGFLSEGPRIAGCDYSMDFLGATWTDNATVRSASEETSPIIQPATTITTIAGGSNLYLIYQTDANTGTAGTSVVGEAFLKAGTHPYVELYIDLDGVQHIWFNLANGTHGGTTGAAITNQGIASLGAGWYHIWAAGITAGGSRTIGVGLVDSDGTAIWDAGAGLTIHVGYIGLIQAASYPTSPIEVESTADVARIGTVLRYAGGRNVADGVGPRTYITRSVVNPNRSGYLWSISDGGSSADRIYLTIEPSTGVARVRTAITAGDSGDATGSTDLTDGDEHEIRVLFAENDLRLFIDGVLEGSDTSVAIPQNLDRWDIGASEAEDNHLDGNITDLRCYRGLRP
jgi:hypothetical protein